MRKFLSYYSRRKILNRFDSWDLDAEIRPISMIGPSTYFRGSAHFEQRQPTEHAIS